MKSILILVFNDLRHDMRVLRQADFLSSHGKLTVVCFDAPPGFPHEVVRIERIRPGFFLRAITAVALLSRLHSLAWRLLYGFPQLDDRLKGKKFDLIVANDIESLPLAFRLKKDARILYDAHEYAPRHFEDKLVWRIFFQRFNDYLCRTWLPKVDAMTTVGEGLAKEYAKNYGVVPTVITNASRYQDLSPAPMIPGKVRLIHHGAANPSRHLELMIQLMDLLDERFELTLMLLVPAIANPKTRGYIERLKTSIASKPRIKVIPAVPADQVVATIHNFDMGLFLLPPVNFNYANTLPNKFFDFVQARLGIAIGPTPEMAQLLTKYQIGVVSIDFTPTSLASKLNALTEGEIGQMKVNAGEAAKILSADANRTIMDSLCRKLI